MSARVFFYWLTVIYGAVCAGLAVEYTNGVAAIFAYVALINVEKFRE